jgi:hypothetical protein
MIRLRHNVLVPSLSRNGYLYEFFWSTVAGLRLYHGSTKTYYYYYTTVFKKEFEKGV